MAKITQTEASDTIALIAPLSEQERNEIDHLLEHYPVASGASIDALKIIQKHQGWVSDAAIKALALHMSLPLADLESVATFYNQIFRKSVGKVRIHPCNGISCMLMGSRKVQQQFNELLAIGEGDTTDNNLFTLISHPCIGACDKAPVMRINDTLHEYVNPEEIGSIIDKLGQEHGGCDG